MTIDREKWPVPPEMRVYSGRDAFLWYVAQAWPLFFGGDEPVQTVFYHDLSHHVLRRGDWQLTLTDISAFPGDEFAGTTEEE